MIGNRGGHRHGRKRATVEACYKLDSKQLRPLWAEIPPGKIATAAGTWTNAEGIAAFLAFRHADEDFFSLRFSRDGKTFSDAQRIRITRTACNYGGARVWFVCPFCQRRAFRLFLYPNFYAGATRLDVFLCRRCMGQGLTYAQRNFGYDLLTLGQTRARRIQKKLRDTSHLWDTLPDKPRYMHWQTYAALCEEHERARELADEGFMQNIVRRHPELLKDLGANVI